MSATAPSESTPATCGAAVYHAVLGRLILPGDDFRTRTRKLIALAGAVVAALAFLIVLATAVGRRPYEWNTLGIVEACITMFVSVPGMLIPYVVLQCRSDRYLPTVFCELFLLGTCTFLCFSAISNVLYAVSTVLATWCVAVVLMSTPLEPLWLVLAPPIYLVDMYNKAYWPAYYRAHFELLENATYAAEPWRSARSDSITRSSAFALGSCWCLSCGGT